MNETATIGLSIEYCDVGNVAELHTHYLGEVDAQPVVIELDLATGSLYAAVNPEIGNARPMAVHHRRVLRWEVGFVPTSQTANRLLDRIEPHAKTLLAEMRIEWDGSSHVGVFSAGAEDTIAAIEQILTAAHEDNDPSTYISEHAAEDWYDTGEDTATGLGLTAATTDEQISDLARNEEREALTLQEPAVLLGVQKYLLDLRNNLRSQG